MELVENLKLKKDLSVLEEQLENVQEEIKQRQKTPDRRSRRC